MKNAVVTFAALSLLTCATAKDLGVAGTTFPIIERDVRQMLVEDATKVDWSQAQDDLKNSAKTFVTNLPKRQYQSVARTQTVWIDPSVVLSSDIQVPVQQADGTYSWKVLAPKGSRVNPLEKFRPVTAFLFFDGSVPSQVELVRQVLAKDATRYVPVEAGQGDVSENNKALRRATFYASDAMLSRFQVQYLPSLVYPGSGQKELFLGNTSFALPYKWQEVVAACPGQTSLAPLRTTGVKK